MMYRIYKASSILSYLWKCIVNCLTNNLHIGIPCNKLLWKHTIHVIMKNLGFSGPGFFLYVSIQLLFINSFTHSSEIIYNPKIEPWKNEKPCYEKAKKAQFKTHALASRLKTNENHSTSGTNEDLTVELPCERTTQYTQSFLERLTVWRQLDTTLSLCEVFVHSSRMCSRIIWVLARPIDFGNEPRNCSWISENDSFQTVLLNFPHARMYLWPKI